MTSLAVTEINETGIIITVATEQTTFWQSVLPIEGDCLFTFADATTNKQLTAFINKIFAKEVTEALSFKKLDLNPPTDAEVLNVLKTLVNKENIRHLSDDQV